MQGFDLFAYCGNNPVNRIDISGANSVEITEEEKTGLLDKTEHEGCLQTGGQEQYSSSSGYKPPSGGGGVTNTITIGDTSVEFGHGGRHLDGTGLTTDQVEQIIAQNVVDADIPIRTHYPGNVQIEGFNFYYSGFRLQEHRINVGTYYIVRH